LFSSHSCLAYSTLSNFTRPEILLVFPGKYQSSITPEASAFLFLDVLLQKEEIAVRILDMRTEDYRSFKVGSPLFVVINATKRTQIKYASLFAHYVRAQNSSVPIVWTGVQHAQASEQAIPCELADIFVKAKRDIAKKLVMV
jgi:hypothetical protein